MTLRKTLFTAALCAAFIAPAFAADAPDDATTEQRRAELRQAQEQLREVTRRIAELSAKLGAADADRAYAFQYLVNPRRAMLGVVLGSEGDVVTLSAVTPGGPADKAGLRAGDRIVAINGKDVIASAKSAPGAVSRAIQGENQVEAARSLIGELQPGQSVDITYERDGKRANAKVAAERRESWNWPMLNSQLGALRGLEPLTIDLRGSEVPGERHIEIIARRAADAADVARDAAKIAHGEVRAAEGMTRELSRMMVFRSGGLFDLKLAEVNPELGRYFGADEGVLVLDKGEEFAELKRGDVILAVGGERAQSVSGVMRALGSARAGDAINVQVMRDKRREVVTITAPDQGKFDVLWRDAPLPPTPPAAPAPPQPPQPAAAPHPRSAKAEATRPDRRHVLL